MEDRNQLNIPNIEDRRRNNISSGQASITNLAIFTDDIELSDTPVTNAIPGDSIMGRKDESIETLALYDLCTIVNQEAM